MALTPTASVRLQCGPRLEMDVEDTKVLDCAHRLLSGPPPQPDQAWAEVARRRGRKRSSMSVKYLPYTFRKDQILDCLPKKKTNNQTSNSLPPFFFSQLELGGTRRCIQD